MDSDEGGLDPVAMTIVIINPGKELWLRRRSNHGPPALKSCTVPTKLHVLGWRSLKWCELNRDLMLNHGIDNTSYHFRTYTPACLDR